MTTQNEVRKDVGFTSSALWDLPFRPFFLLASIGSIVSISVWIAVLNGVSMPMEFSGLPVNIWHAHEMIFGFAGAAAVGFLLTAAQTWTNSRSTHGRHLLILAAIWLASRVSFWVLPVDWLMVSASLQMLWWCLSIVALSKILMSSASKRHYIFILLISTMMVTNGLVLWFAHNQQFLFATHLSQATVLLFTVLISIIAGRTFPFFTERGLKNVTLKKTKILDVLIPVASIINVVIFLSSISNQFKVLAAILLMVTGLLHCIRLLYWKPQLTVKTPLLWSLQLSYGFLGIGLITLGMSYLMVGIRFNDALHLLTIGTMGAMILSIMSRVSLGHTGQPIVASRLIIVAFMGVFVSALIRFLLPLLMEFQLSWNLSGFFWVMSFTIFIIKFTPILVSPKA